MKNKRPWSSQNKTMVSKKTKQRNAGQTANRAAWRASMPKKKPSQAASRTGSVRASMSKPKKRHRIADPEKRKKAAKTMASLMKNTSPTSTSVAKPVAITIGRDTKTGKFMAIGDAMMKKSGKVESYRRKPRG